MAVEMCKLSLWLVSLDPKLPFSFVDDKILHGNSLLGLTDARQLKRQHINPDAASNQQTLFEIDVDGILRQAIQLRRHLANEVNNADPQRSVNTKRRQWHRFQEVTAQLTEIADAVVATGLKLGGKPGRALNVAYENLGIALGEADPTDLFANEPRRSMLEDILEAGLTPTVATDYARWKPLHWIIAVPDVMERGGFDAIVGNPPFLGDVKIAGAMGANLRDWYANVLAGGAKGKSDLVAHFFLRAMLLLNNNGNLGLIATNSVAQGATRKVGLKQMLNGGAFTITRAVQSKTWPAASANLEYAAVWGTRAAVAAVVPRISDGIPVEQISSILEPGEDVDPVRLAENLHVSFEGFKPNGMGFVIDPEEARSWIERAQKNSKVLFPYLNGEELNARPDCSASRWIIDFYDRTEEESRAYSLPYERLLERVKPERAKKPKAIREAPWWLFLRTGPALRKAIADLDDVLVLTRVSKTVVPVRVGNGQAFSDRLLVFAENSYEFQAVMSSSIHWSWGVKYSTTMRLDPSYSPSGAFETFPRPRTDCSPSRGRSDARHRATRDHAAPRTSG